MNYLDFGTGHVVVFLHGWGGDARAFLFVGKAVKCRAIIPDMYGFGETPHPDYPLTVADYANGILELLDGLGVEKAVFVGHSFGGRVAIEIAGKYSERVEKLVLIDSAGIKPHRGFKYYSRVILHKILKKFGRGLSGSEDYKNLSPVMKQTFINVVNYDETYLLKNIACDTAIFWGENDKDTPMYMAKKLNKKIKNSHLFVLTKASHYSYLDNMEEFLSILSAFINGV